MNSNELYNARLRCLELACMYQVTNNKLGKPIPFDSKLAVADAEVMYKFMLRNGGAKPDVTFRHLTEAP